MRMRRGQRAATAASWVTMTIVRPARWSASNVDEDVRGRLAVEVAGGLVGEHQVGVVDERAGDGHALLLAAGELGRRWVTRSARPTELQRAAAEAADVGAIRVDERQLHVLERAGPRQQVEGLEDEADPRVAQPRLLSGALVDTSPPSKR